MDELVWIGAAVSAVLLLTAAVWAWWDHRARLVDLQRRLTWNEQSRFALERHAQDVDVRLAAIANSLHLPRQPPETPTPTATPTPQGQPDDASERRRCMEDALDRADAAAEATLAQADAVHGVWRETEPLPLTDTCFAPTMPLELRDEERVFQQRLAAGRRTVRQ